MRHAASILTVSCLAFCLALSGCASKVRYEEDLVIDGQDTGKEKIIAGPTKDQKVKIELIGATEVVNLIIFLGKDEAKARKDLENSKESSPSWIGSKMKVKDADIEITVPAKEEIHIFIQPESGKSTTAKLKVNSL